MDADLANKIFRIAIRGTAFEDSGLAPEHRKHYDQAKMKMAASEPGIIPSSLQITAV